ncbi:MAG: DUF2127 domain-containing protein [Candidatus Nanopelagicales bacterium]
MGSEYPVRPPDSPDSHQSAVNPVPGWRPRWRDWFATGDALDRTFAVGIIAKGLDGIIEILGGLLLVLATPDAIRRVLEALTRGELAEDPTDFLATRLLHLSASDSLTTGGLRFAAIYLLAHGVVKVVLVAAVLRGKLWAYPWMIGFLLLFIGYQLYRIAVDPTAGMIALTIFDAVLTWLAVREWRRHRHAP